MVILAAHLSRHLLALEYLARIGAGTVGTLHDGGIWNHEP